MSIASEFRAFVMRGNVVDLAVGVVIGAAFGKIVDSLVKDLFMPVVGVLTGGIDFTEYAFTLWGDAKIGVGSFIQAVINFVVIAFCLFVVIKVMNRLRGPVDAPTPPEPTPTEKLLIEIRDELRKEKPPTDPSSQPML